MIRDPYIISSVGQPAELAEVKRRLAVFFDVLLDVDVCVAGMRQEAKQEFRDAGYKGCGFSDTLVRGGRVRFYYAGKTWNGWRFIERG